MPHAKRAVSLNQLSIANAPAPQFIAAAHAAGFRHVGLRLSASSVPLADDVLGDPGAIRAIKQACATTGIRVADIDHFPITPQIDFDTIPRILDAAAEIGAAYISTSGLDPEPQRLADHLVRLCRMAAERKLTVGLEFMIYRQVRTIAEAAALVTQAAQPNLGVLLDPLHLDRSNGTAEAVAALSPGLIAYGQLCDAPAAKPPISEMGAEGGYGRLLPGDGDLRLAEFIEALPADRLISIEVPNRTTSGLSFVERAERAARATERLLSL